ncbi:TPA: hypothetical protein ACGO1T_000530 [Streptococcus suis]
MSRDYFKYFQDKVNLRGALSSDRNFNRQQREFDLYFLNAPNKNLCKINGQDAELVFIDQNQSNNKDLSDDKYVIARNGTDIKVGDYIIWSDTEWLAFTEEYKTIRTHQQLKVKHVNETIKWIRNGEIINDGKGYGAYVQSQTLYTMGVATSNTLHVVDSKMSLYIQNNKDTQELQMGERIIVGRRAYKLNFIDDVSRPGLISFLLDEDTLSEYDNIELGVADYGKYFGKSDIEKPTIENTDSDRDTDGFEIVGNDRVKVGSTYHYATVGFSAKSWSIESLFSDQPFIVQNSSGNSLTVVVKDDYKLIGKKANIVAITDDGAKITHPITIIKKF